VDVSVIMSTHNRAHYLDDALGALAAQNCHAAFEVIVIDNASVDDTNTVLESWCRKNSRFRTAYEARPGLSCGKNAGIRLARAPLLLFTDDDTLADPHWIDAYLDLFARHRNERMIAGGTQIPTPHDLGPWPEWFAEPAMVNVAMLDYGEERMLTPFEYVWGANMAVPRSVFDKCGEWDETVGRKGDSRGTFEDTEFQDRTRAAGIAVWFCPDAVIRHRIARETLTPRRITAAAFARGRNQLARQSSHGSREIDSVPKHNALKVLFRLAANLMKWAFWVMTFRVFRRKGIFERARHAAFASGHTLETLRTGRDSLRMYFAAGRIVLGLRRVVLRLCPDFV
jgi:glycosyltransferase involved in cell wall biosynthesis